jgi:hypothetical protein
MDDRSNDTGVAISDASYAGLTRVSIFEKRRHCRKKDCRVKPGKDGPHGVSAARR